MKPRTSPCRLLRGLLAALLLTAAPALADTDYDPASTAWNGLSTLLATASKAQVQVTPANHLDWASLSEREVLFLLSPSQAPSASDRKQLQQFLQAGGRLIVADDFREGDRWLAGSGLRLDAPPLPDPAAPAPGWQGNPVWPEVELAREGGNSPLPPWVNSQQRYAPLAFLGHNLTKPVVLNHPASVVASRPGHTAVWGPWGAGWLADSDAGWLAEAEVQGGRVLVLSDPSALLNTMLGRFHDNRQFSANLLRYYCVASRPCEVRLLTGPLTTSGAFVPQHARRTPGLRAGLEQLADWLAALADLAKGPLVQPALLLALLAWLGLPIWRRARLPGPVLPPAPAEPRHTSVRTETIARWLSTPDADYRRPARLLASHLARWLERVDRDAGVRPAARLEPDRGGAERLPDAAALTQTQAVLREQAGWSPQALARLAGVLQDLRRASVEDGPPVSRAEFARMAGDVEWAETLLRHTTTGRARQMTEAAAAKLPSGQLPATNRSPG